jgi:hypothetical protein
VISALGRYHRFFSDDYTVEYPAGSGNRLTLDKVAVGLQDRLISIIRRRYGLVRPIGDVVAVLGGENRP